MKQGLREMAPIRKFRDLPEALLAKGASIPLASNAS
jgi:hypothetical protein